MTTTATAAGEETRSVAEGALLWTPSAQFVESSQLRRFENWLDETRGLRFAEYSALWRWSVAKPEAFWAAIWQYFGVESSTPYVTIRSGAMPQTRWFAGCRINFTEHLLRHEREAAPGEVAIVAHSELRAPIELTWHELGSAVRRLAMWLRALGIQPGDRIVSYMPNIPETAIAMMAATALGAIWSSAAPEFGTQTVLDRFAQIEPKLLFAADGYRFGGKDFDRSAEVASIAAGLPALEHVVWLPYLDAAALPRTTLPATGWGQALSGPDIARADFAYERVDEHHPLWILFSSGTTGLPKPIVHSHVGMTVELLKTTAFHLDLGPGSRMFFFSTTGWMMWNALVAALLQGASIVLYDGHPAAPVPDLLWQLTQDAVVCG